MPLYNNSFMNETTNHVDILTGVGSAIGQPYLFGYMILVIFFLVYIFRMKVLDTQTIAVGSFLTTLLAILLSFINLVDAIAIISPAVIFFFAILFYFIS